MKLQKNLDITQYSRTTPINYRTISRAREVVNHSKGEYVRMIDAANVMAAASTNNTESAWSMLKRAISGVYHKMPPKHLRRYARSFAGQWNIRDLDTEEQMEAVVRAMLGRPLTYAHLIEDNGLASGSRRSGAIRDGLNAAILSDNAN